MDTQKQLISKLVGQLFENNFADAKKTLNLVVTEKVKAKVAVISKKVKEDDCKKCKGVVKEEYSDKNKKYDILVDGEYAKSTKWAKNSKEAKENYLKSYPEDKDKNVTVEVSEKQ